MGRKFYFTNAKGDRYRKYEAEYCVSPYENYHSEASGVRGVLTDEELFDRINLPNMRLRAEAEVEVLGFKIAELLKVKKAGGRASSYHKDKLSLTVTERENLIELIAFWDKKLEQCAA